METRLYGDTSLILRRHQNVKDRFFIYRLENVSQHHRFYMEATLSFLIRINKYFNVQYCTYSVFILYVLEKMLMPMNICIREYSVINTQGCMVV